MTCWVQLEELAIESVRQPGERMPISCVKGCERPFHRVPGQTCAHVIVMQKIDFVVEVREPVMDDRSVESQRQKRQ
jgi:hypothetical protein